MKILQVGGLFVGLQLDFNYLHSSALEDYDSSRVTATYYQI